MSDTFYVIGEDTAKDIADSIRRKRGYTDNRLIKVEDYNDEIDNIESPISGVVNNNSSQLNLILGAKCPLRSYAFYKNTAIKTANLNFTAILEYAFSGCSNLQTLQLNEATYAERYSFDACSSLNSVTLSKATWFGDSVFNNCTNLTAVDAPMLTNTGNYTFKNLSKLESFNAPKLTTIGFNAFNHCTGLKRINSEVDGVANFPELTTFNYSNSNAFYPFEAVNLIKEVHAPKLTNSGQYAFKSMTELEEVTIDALTSLGRNIFDSDAKLKRVNSDVDGVANLPKIISCANSVFNGCVSLTTILLPNCTTMSDGYQFQGCTNLQTVDAGKTNYFSNSTFNNCPNLTSIIIRKSEAIVNYNVNAISGTTVPTNITFYVPSNLVSAYEASQWVTAKGVKISALVEQLTIDSDTFDCVAGESWSSWVASENNTDGYVTVGNIIMDSTKTNYVTQNGVAVLPGQVINGTAYDLTALNS